MYNGVINWNLQHAIFFLFPHADREHHEGRSSREVSDMLKDNDKRPVAQREKFSTNVQFETSDSLSWHSFKELAFNWLVPTTLLLASFPGPTSFDTVQH